MLVESDELPELYEGTGFEGVNPRNAKLMTPNVVLSSTPAAAGGGGQGVASTPGSVMSGMTNTTGGKMLQIRDHFGLNEPYAGDDHTSMADDESMVSFQSTQPSIATTSASNFQYAGQQRKQLASKLMSLPEPEFIYEVKVPETSGSSVTLEDVEVLWYCVCACYSILLAYTGMRVLPILAVYHSPPAPHFLTTYMSCVLCLTVCVLLLLCTGGRI